jgi:hypothetical protein
VGLIIEADDDLEVENCEFLMGRIGRPMHIVLRIKSSEKLLLRILIFKALVERVSGKMSLLTLDRYRTLICIRQLSEIGCIRTLN